MEPRSTCLADPGLREGLRQLSAAKLGHSSSAGSRFRTLSVCQPQQGLRDAGMGKNVVLQQDMTYSTVVGKLQKDFCTPPEKGSPISPAQQALSRWSILVLSCLSFPLHEKHWCEVVQVRESVSLHVQRVCQQASTSGGMGSKVVAYLQWQHLLSVQPGAEIPMGDVRRRFALPVQAWKAQKRLTTRTAQPWQTKRHW